MKSKYLAITIITGAIALCAFATLQAQSKTDPLSGKYSGKFQGDKFGSLASTIEFTNSAGTVSGTVQIPETPHGAMKGAIVGTYADGKIEIKFDMGMFKGTISATLTGDTISGTWTGEEGSGTVNWKRA